MLVALIVMIVEITQSMGLDFKALSREMANSSWTRVLFLMIGSVNSILSNSFKWSFYSHRYDWFGPGYDAKNLSCKSLPEAQKYVLVWCCFYTVNLLFLTLGF